MPKDATPARYVVDQRGVQDPDDSEYYVINVVHDTVARALLWLLVRWYRNRASKDGTSVKADELAKLLKDTDEACMRNIESRNGPNKQKVGRPKSARPQ